MGDGQAVLTVHRHIKESKARNFSASLSGLGAISSGSGQRRPLARIDHGTWLTSALEPSRELPVIRSIEV
jgi:hypothetical protein